MKFNKYEFGHLENMAAMPVYGKIILKKPSPESMDWLPWKLVCSIGVSGPIVLYSNDDWLDLDPNYIKVEFGRICFFFFFFFFFFSFETVVACEH